MPNVLIVNSALALALAGLDPLQGNDPYNRIEPVRLSTTDEWAVPYSLLTDVNQPAYKRALVAGAEVRNITQVNLFSPASDARNFAKFRLTWRGHSYFPQLDMTKPCFEIDPAAGMISLVGHKTIIGRAADTDPGSNGQPVDRSRSELSHDIELPRGVDLWTSFWFRRLRPLGGSLMTEMCLWQIHHVDEAGMVENLSPPVMVRQASNLPDAALEGVYRGFYGTSMENEAPTNYAFDLHDYDYEQWCHHLIHIVQGNQNNGTLRYWITPKGGATQQIANLTEINNHFINTLKLDYDKFGYYSAPASTTFLLPQFYDLNPTSTTSLAHLIGNPGTPPGDAWPTALIEKVAAYAATLP